MARAGEGLFRELRLGRGAAAALVLMAGLIAAAVIYRQPIAEYLLMLQLQKLGLDRVEFTVDRLDTGLLELRNLRVGEGDDLKIDRIEARFSITGLFGSRLDALRISGAQLRGTLDDAGLSFGDLDALLATSKTETRSSGPTALPMSGVEIDDARLNLDTESGALEVRLDAHVLETERGRLEGSATLSADHPLANLTIGLNAAGSPSSLAGVMELKATASGELGARTSAQGVSLSANAEFSFTDGELAIRSNECAVIHIAEFSVQDVASLTKPLDLCLRFQGEHAIRISRDGALEARLELEPATFAIDLQAGAESLRVAGELPAIKARIPGARWPFEIAIETEAGRLQLSEPEVGVRGIALSTRLSSEGTVPSGKLRIRELFDPDRPRRFSNLSLDGRFEPNETAIDFEMELANDDRNFVLDIRGSHDLTSDTGRAEFALAPIEFLPSGIQPDDLVPMFAGSITEASGSIGMVGSADWREDGLRARFDISVVDLSVTSEAGSFERMNANFSIGNDWVIAIESASWEFAGGTLTTAGTIDPQAPKPELTVLAKGLDLATLLTFVNLEGLSGSGTLDGEIPIIRKGGETRIRKAQFHSVGTGDVIRYRPEASVASVGVTDSQFAMVLAVLENFHYERIDIELDGDPLGKAAVEIHLKGSNPDYKDGHPVELNLPVEAPFSSLLRIQALFYKIPELLEERVRARIGRKK